MVYYYFVSGVILNNGNNIFFNSEIVMLNEISSFEEVRSFCNKIAFEKNVTPDNVLILCYQLLRVE